VRQGGRSLQPIRFIDPLRARHALIAAAARILAREESSVPNPLRTLLPSVQILRFEVLQRAWLRASRRYERTSPGGG